MKTDLALLLLLSVATSGFSATTINSANKFSYGANLGWMDWRGDTNNGAVIGEYVCSGYIYSANVGWINLGAGSPTNGIQYQNLSTNDFGVNLDGLGNLNGNAWGANIGWIVFTNGTATGALSSADSPKVNMSNGRLGGYAYSANCGWISLSNAVAYVQTDTIQRGALAPNGLPVAWLLQNFGTTNVNANADSDGDSMSASQEYLAGTNPNDSNDYLHITFVARDSVLNNTTLHWTSVPTRAYAIQSHPAALNAESWADVVAYGFGVNSSTFDDGATNGLDFYRIRAFRPLGP